MLRETPQLVASHFCLSNDIFLHKTWSRAMFGRSRKSKQNPISSYFKKSGTYYEHLWTSWNKVHRPASFLNHGFVWFVPPVHVRIFPRPTTLKPVETYSLQLDEQSKHVWHVRNHELLRIGYFPLKWGDIKTLLKPPPETVFLKVKMQYGMPAVDWGESIYPAWWTSKYHLAQHEKTWLPEPRNMTYTYLHSL